MMLQPIVENAIVHGIIPKQDTGEIKIKLEIIFEDKDLLVVNKPSGMVVHPGAGNYEKTLVNALIYKYKIQFNLFCDHPCHVRNVCSRKK